MPLHVTHSADDGPLQVPHEASHGSHTPQLAAYLPTGVQSEGQSMQYAAGTSKPQPPGGLLKGYAAAQLVQSEEREEGEGCVDVDHPEHGVQESHDALYLDLGEQRVMADPRPGCLPRAHARIERCALPYHGGPW